MLDFLTRPRPDYSLPTEELNLPEAVNNRKRWLRRIRGLRPRIDSELAPPIVDAVHLWLSKYGEQESASTQAKITGVNATFEALQSSADNLIIKNGEKEDKQSLQAFSAFLTLAESLPDYLNHPNALTKRIHNLLEALTDRKHPSWGSKDGLSTELHDELRRRVLSVAAAALGACGDKLDNGLKLLEDVVLMSPAEHFTRLDKHVPFARRRYGNYGLERVAELKAIALRIDGYHFPKALPNGKTINPDEMVELQSFYNVHVDSKYFLGSQSQSMENLQYVIQSEKLAYPEETKDMTDDQIISRLKKQTEDILEECSNNPDGKSPTLDALRKRAENVLKEDGRLQDSERGILSKTRLKKHGLDPEKEFVKPFDRYFATEYGYYKDFIDAVSPVTSLINTSSRDQEKALISEIESLEEQLDMRPTPPRRPEDEPTLVEPEPLSEEANDNQILQHELAVIRYERDKNTYADRHEEWKKK